MLTEKANTEIIDLLREFPAPKLDDYLKSRELFPREKRYNHSYGELLSEQVIVQGLSVHEKHFITKEKYNQCLDALYHAEAILYHLQCLAKENMPENS